MQGINGEEYILTPAEIKHFHRHGYVKLSAVLTDIELQTIDPIFEEFIQGKVPNMGKDFCDMSGPYDRAFENFSLVNAVLPIVYKPIIQGNIFEKRSASIAKQLLGINCQLDYDQFLAKRPNKSDAVFTWHQDLGYWPTGTPGSTLTATCSLALDDADQENGCLKVIPGSQKRGLQAHKPLFEDREKSHILSVDVNDAENIVLLPLNRGDITVHDELIIHGSGGNESKERWRKTFITAFRSKECVEFERSIGFTHSHNDVVNWETHLGSLQK
jgi:hypothetical protein